MVPTVRIYASEQDASAAARAAEEAGFDPVCFLAPSTVAGRERQAVESAVEAECIAGSQVRVCTNALQRGQSVVGVFAPFGRGLEAELLLGRHGPIEVVDPPVSRNPAPFSSALGLPVLANYSPMTDLSIIRFTFGEPRLSRNPSPLSSLVGLKTLTAPKRKKSSFGLPLLSRSAAPFSSLLRLPLLSRSTKKSSSFGLPLLSSNPTPLSSLLGLRVLSRKKKNDRG